MPRRAVTLVSLVLAAACASDADTAADTAVAAAPSADAPAVGADVADVTAYELTMERMDRYYAAQRALAVRVRDMTPGEREAFDMSGDAEGSLDDMARRFDGNPTVAAALAEAGLSGREFATLTLAIVQSGLAAAMLQAQPGANEDSLLRDMNVNPANVRFMREHDAALQRRQAELEAELRRLGAETDG